MRIINLKNNQNEWNNAINKLSQFLLNKKIFKKLPVQQKEGLINFIPYSDILYRETWEGEVKIFTLKDEYYFEGTLSGLEKRLQQEGFMRVHKSYIVNLKKIESLIPWFKGTYWIIMEGIKMKISVSKSIIKELKNILGIKVNT